MNCPEETSFLRGRDVSQMKATRPLPGAMPRAGLKRDVSVEHGCRKAWLRHYARAGSFAGQHRQIRPGSRCMLVSTCQFEVAHPRSRSNKRLSCRRGTARRSPSFGTAWMILFSYDDWRNRFPMALQTTDTLSLRVICR